MVNSVRTNVSFPSESELGKPSDLLPNSPPVFQPIHVGSNTSKKFISSISIVMLVIFFLLLRSSAGPFLNPNGEAKKSKSSFFFTVTCFLYIWITSVTVVTLIPSFSHHYNGIIAASLFFPMTFSSIAVLLAGRFFIRLKFYILIRCGVLKYYNVGGKNVMMRQKKKKNIEFQYSSASLKPKMIAFHRPFRKLAKNAFILSGALCLLHAHCWSRTLSVFKASSEDGAVCRAVFTPFVRGNDEVGANESCIWYLWSAALFIMLISFAQDEWNGLHYQKINGNNDTYDDKVVQYMSESDDEEVDDKSSIENYQGAKSFRGGIHSLSNYLSESTKERPKDTLEMVPWLSLFAASCTLDIFLQLLVFAGRVDGRSMQAALQRNIFATSEAHNCKTCEEHKETDEEKYRNLQRRYKGCIFDYSSKLKRDSENGFWFDFMADCGDGFNSSYQVARMLAQPNITATDKKGERRQLPRGQLLINGGDLAYPSPTEYNYEKRFFRTFEDAMPVPPSFRRSKIATKKPDLPVNGWDDCFHGNPERDDSGSDVHELYKGPSSFIIPGNHDWYDGLATYSRLILCRDWLGGWLLPQQRSYFALKLQQGWWVLGMDCALSSDIDIEQYKFFADIADSLIGAEDAVIIVNHEPHWVTDFDDCKHGDEMSEQNIRELMQTHLKGKVRLRIAGDLHHYTRHVTVRKKPEPIKKRNLSHHYKQSQKKGKLRSRSLSFDETQSLRDGNLRYDEHKKLQPFTERNRPELIVSGGGGAFLHGTHNLSSNIKFGEDRLHYERVCAYPSEKVSYFIGSLNLWHFRSRNYRADWLMALLYFGLVSSLLPLCGLYSDYETFNPKHDVNLLIIWSLRKTGSLMWRIVTSENVSLLWSFLVIGGAIGLQVVDKKIHPVLRLFCALVHGFAHIAAALLCLLFVQSVTEWIVQDDIVKISVPNQHYNGTHLASFLYGEYKNHFFPVLENYTDPEASKLAQYYAESQLDHDSESPVLKRISEILLNSWKWIYTTLPLLKTTLSIFDLPGLIAREHKFICTSLCAGGLECLLTHDKYRFLTIERTSYLKYMVAVSLYFICVAIPFAGGIFGTWLTISSNIFNSQGNLSFSALMVEHYKNFIKLHIKENGDLEVFAIGLQNVPTKWVKDKKWDGRQSKRKKQESKPSWAWDRPSKWVPMKESKTFQPQVVDYTCIQKRQINTSSSK